MLHDAKKVFRTCARRQTFHLTLNREWQYIFFPKCERSQNNHGERDDGADQQRPHEDAALGKKSDNGFKDVRHLKDQFGNMVKVICSSNPSGGRVLATSSGIGGTWISKMDWRQTLANASFEVFFITLMFFTRPLRST